MTIYIIHVLCRSDPSFLALLHALIQTNICAWRSIFAFNYLLIPAWLIEAGIMLPHLFSPGQKTRSELPWLHTHSNKSSQASDWGMLHTHHALKFIWKINPVFFFFPVFMGRCIMGVMNLHAQPLFHSSLLASSIQNVLNFKNHVYSTILGTLRI